MKQLIEYIVSNIVNHPENVVVTETEAGEGITKYLIEVNPEDVGRVIGKQGKVIKAIRQIVRIAAIQKGTRAIVDLKEEGKEFSQQSEEVEEAAEVETVEEEKVEEIVEEKPEEKVETPTE